jgi:hypothetical protein
MAQWLHSSCKFIYVSNPTFKVSFIITSQSYKLFQGVYFVDAFFSQVLKLVFHNFQITIMSFQKFVAFVALMVFASQGAMAAPQYHPDLGLRAPQTARPFTSGPN